MCQLLGVSAAQPQDIRQMVDGFLCRGGRTDHHADGWGLGWYDPADRACTLRGAGAGAYSPIAGQWSALGVQSRQFIAHVRKATRGRVCRDNSHPFRRHLWGRDWLFAHNGDLDPRFRGERGLFEREGGTDSEAAFCHLLNRLFRRFGLRQPDEHTLFEALAVEVAALARLGTFNMLLGDGERLFVYCASQLHAGLSAEGDVVVSTQPVEAGSAWQALTPGSLRLYRGAHLLAEHRS